MPVKDGATNLRNPTSSKGCPEAGFRCDTQIWLKDGSCLRPVWQAWSNFDISLDRQSHTIMILIMIILFTVWMTHDKWSWEVWSFLEIRWCPSRCCVSVLCWQGHNDPNWARSLNRIRWPGCSLQNMAVTRSQNTLWSQWAIAGGGSRVNPLVINRNTSTGFNWLIQGDCGPDVSSDRFLGAPWLLYNAWHVSFLVRPWICSRVRD